MLKRCGLVWGLATRLGANRGKCLHLLKTLHAKTGQADARRGRASSHLLF